MKKYLFLVLIALQTLTVNAQSEVIIAGDNVCLRFYPTEESKWTGGDAPHLFTGNRLRCLGQAGGYYKVMYGGDIYYVPKRYARPRGLSSGNRVAATSYDYIIVSGDNVCFRAQPNERSKLTGPGYKHVSTGEYLRCVGTMGNYYKVSYGGSYFYIPKKYGRPRY